ncbi:hypothetical protein SAMN04488128_103378 [Chitinophaga eiseniae]|uniref:Uncharacterized protein n=1 Tax=Chitinophaga eiseniae TaxID=634771 RepID=A0A1T4SRQ1_9BACT|nr:hypothetical protein [Chitinophaga eiseniae]SKA30934.1 hypothetical protein SAMN04488128_103378 [Chitinophaga eiseniae]
MTNLNYRMHRTALHEQACRWTGCRIVAGVCHHLSNSGAAVDGITSRLIISRREVFIPGTDAAAFDQAVNTLKKL